MPDSPRRTTHRRSLTILLGLLLACYPFAATFAQTDEAPGQSGAAAVSAGEENAESASMETGGLHWIDGVVIAAYVLFVLGLGWYYSRIQTTTDEYFVGNRGMNPILVGISIFATLFSTISYLSVPGEVIEHGPVFLAGLLAIPVAYGVVGYFLVPVYMRHRVTSAYELLEARLGIVSRLIGACMFIGLRLIWMSLLIFLASKAMLVMLGLPESIDILGLEVSSLTVVTVLTGSVAIFYSTMGGLRAVVITDLFQSLLLFGGALLVLITVTYRLGSLEWIPRTWDANWDTQPAFSMDPFVRVTLFGSMLQLGLWWICTAGGDQTAIQRFMSTRDARSARRSFLMNSCSGATVMFVLALVGFALLAYFKEFSGALPAGMSVEENADLLFPRYISYHLPVGLSGLVVSGMFAAAMSSIDSGVNSISAVVTTDFIDRFRDEPMSQKGHVRLAQILALTVGVIVVSVSSRMELVPGNFLEMTKRTHELFVAPLFVMFFLAMFVPFSTQIGAIVGAAVSLLTALFVGYSDQWAEVESGSLSSIVPPEQISFQWILPSALAMGLATGLLVSLVTKSKQAPPTPPE